MHCPHCNTEYLVDELEVGRFLGFYERFEQFLQRYSPHAVGLASLGFIYISAIFNGAMVVMQAYGSEEGLKIIENSGFTFKLIGLPSFPCCFMIVRMIQWKILSIDLVHCLQNLSLPEISLSRTFLPPQIENKNGNLHSSIKPRTICEVLLVPLISSALGELFTNCVEGSLKRMLLGGFLFIITENACKFYYKKKKSSQPKIGKIIDYSKENARRHRQE